MQPLTLVREKLQRQPWQPKTQTASLQVHFSFFCWFFFSLRSVSQRSLAALLLATLCDETRVTTRGFSSGNQDVATSSKRAASHPRSYRGRIDFVWTRFYEKYFHRLDIIILVADESKYVSAQVTVAVGICSRHKNISFYHSARSLEGCEEGMFCQCFPKSLRGLFASPF